MKALTLLLVLAGAAQADPGYYQVRPYSEPGQTTLELRYWATSSNSRPRAHWPELGLRRGFGPRWSSGLLASWISARHIPSRLDSWNWINDWLLLDGVGDHSFSLALHSQLIRSKGDERTLELGPALQADAGRWQAQLTLLVERPLNGQRATELKLQWQLNRRWQPGWRVGLQGFSELGRWDRLTSAGAQSHRAGPLLSYTEDLGQGRSLQLQASWLFGKTFGRSGSMLSSRIAYGF